MEILTSILLVIISKINVAGQCFSSLKNVTPAICVGGSYVLDLSVESVSSDGIWTVHSVALTSIVDAVIVT